VRKKEIMRFDKFVDSLLEAGWLSSNDAQHTQIRKLWKKMYPTVAELEDELEESENENRKLRKELDFNSSVRATVSYGSNKEQNPAHKGIQAPWNSPFNQKNR
jgi:cell shape-determining protein MreC